MIDMPSNGEQNRRIIRGITGAGESREIKLSLENNKIYLSRNDLKDIKDFDKKMFGTEDYLIENNEKYPFIMTKSFLFTNDEKTRSNSFLKSIYNQNYTIPKKYTLNIIKKSLLTNKEIGHNPDLKSKYWMISPLLNGMLLLIQKQRNVITIWQVENGTLIPFELKDIETSIFHELFKSISFDTTLICYFIRYNEKQELKIVDFIPITKNDIVFEKRYLELIKLAHFFSTDNISIIGLIYPHEKQILDIYRNSGEVFMLFDPNHKYVNGDGFLIHVARFDTNNNYDDDTIVYNEKKFKRMLFKEKVDEKMDQVMDNIFLDFHGNMDID